MKTKDSVNLKIIALREAVSARSKQMRDMISANEHLLHTQLSQLQKEVLASNKQKEGGKSL